jgi:hypothetical protein
MKPTSFVRTALKYQGAVAVVVYHFRAFLFRLIPVVRPLELPFAGDAAAAARSAAACAASFRSIN